MRPGNCLALSLSKPSSLEISINRSLLPLRVAAPTIPASLRAPHTLTTLCHHIDSYIRINTGRHGAMGHQGMFRSGRRVLPGKADAEFVACLDERRFIRAMA
jgi:hypothetical protein